ncbi:MAG: GmrSD restriction endonuclease domain-containing protein [Thermoleophilia bacterium]
MTETLFKDVNWTVNLLIQSIEMGSIGLPDIQRPFVWKNTKVRDLIDSMYRGYPVGYLLFWQNAYDGEGKAIGTDGKQKTPSLLIVDGQQRLTSLFAVVKGKKVLRENFAQEAIEIAFNPLSERFEVADAAIKKDKAFIPNISVFWEPGADVFELVDSYLEGLESVRELTDDEKKKIKKSISRLHNLTGFPFTALELASTIDEEQVAEVFVRINSKGTPLNQADFILTLMSVFWDNGRTELERFCRQARTPSTGSASSFNHFIRPSPDQLLRVCVGLGFKRARLQHVYSILRGKDLDTGEFSVDRRDAQFDVLKGAQAETLNLQEWHDYFKAIAQSGHRGGGLVTSETALLFTYVFYLMGRTEYGVDEHTLRRLIARWFFMTSLTGRYTSSPESAMESDLARLRDIKTADGFVHAMGRVCDSTLTTDFWNITLPNELATSSPRSPSLFAYIAALVLLDARVLFSTQKVADALDPSVHAQRAAAERHHLFPKGYLSTLGITEIRDTNQIANYALVDWGDNAGIGDSPPVDYLPKMLARFSSAELQQMYYWHALPDGWEHMEYASFLEARRELMAQVIKDGYSRLDGGLASAPECSLAELIGTGETTAVEFKSCLRKNLHTGQHDPRIEHGVLKTIAGFLNAHGGTLVIGVADDGSPVGIQEDGFENEDKAYLHLVNLINSRIGPKHMLYLHVRFDDYKNHRVMVVTSGAARSPVFLKDGGVERFYLRTGASTTQLTASQTHDYAGQRFVAGV